MLNLIEAPTHDLSAAELQRLFAVPLLMHHWPGSAALNADLCDLIRARLAASPGVVNSNRGGWQSTHDLESWAGTAVEALLDRIRRLMAELVERTVEDPEPAHREGWRIVAWANVNRRGHDSHSHNHVWGNNSWSGIYYVATGCTAEEARRGGRTVFEDRAGVPQEILRHGDPFGREFAIPPSPGLMCLFPAALRHRVEPHPGSEPRITIAFNLSHPGFTIPAYPEIRKGPAWKAFLWENFRGPMWVVSQLTQTIRP